MAKNIRLQQTSGDWEKIDSAIKGGTLSRTIHHELLNALSDYPAIGICERSVFEIRHIGLPDSIARKLTCVSNELCMSPSHFICHFILDKITGNDKLPVRNKLLQSKLKYINKSTD